MHNLIPNFIVEKYTKNQTSGSFFASTMFLDISGFTPMTERLMQEGKEGAEILSSIINSVFGPVIQTVYSSGGFIASFAGDAFTAIFPDAVEKPLQVVACALEIEQIFGEIGKQQTKFGEFELVVKLGLSYGEVDFCILGSKKQQTYYFRGVAIDGCAKSENQCQKMDIILDEKLLEVLPSELINVLKIDDRYYKLTACSHSFSKIISPITEINPNILAKFIPDQVLALDQQGEFREIVAVFISFKESKNIVELNDTIIETIDRCDKFGGYFNRTLFGDKGCMMLICFGMPKSYENNLVRALDFALDIQKQMGDTVRIGLNSGVAYAGFIGSSISSEYTAYGDIVNQAARFMAGANWGKIWTSENTSSKAAKLYSFNSLGKMQFKGKSAPIAILELNARAENSETAFFIGEMVGRKEELASLADFAKPVSENKFAGIMTVYAEAGMGKSRLVYEFVKAQHGVEVLFLQTDSVLRMSLNPFKYLLHNYFNQNKAVNKEQKKANFEAVFALLLMILNNSSDERKLAIVKEIERTKSILAAQVDVFYENSLHEQLDAKGRFENTLFAYKEFFKALSLFKPVIIQIEDIHWLDDDSHKLVQTLCRAVDDFPILIVATSRFNDDGSKPVVKVDKEVIQSEIVLDKLDTESGKYFMELQLERPADAELISFVCNKAEYNPFYIEQIVCYLKENNLLAEKDGRCFLVKQEIAIPNSISAIIIARIDRLEYDVKNLLQMASVFGREVELKTFLIMIELYQLKLEQSQLKSMLEKIEDEQLWNKFAEIKYIFKHALLNEAAYEMQLKSRLRDLHKLAAQSLEKLYNNEEEKFYEIARHYDKAEEINLAANYYEKAGNWLKKNYQNAKALECYDRILAFLDEKKDAERVIDVLVKKGQILLLIGNIKEAENAFNSSFTIADRNSNKPCIMKILGHQGKLKFMQRDFQQGEKCFQKVLALALELEDQSMVTTTFGNIGSYYYYTNELDKAKEYYLKQYENSLKLNLKSDEAIALANIGLIYLAKNDYDEAMAYYEKSYNFAKDNSDYSFRSHLCSKIGEIHFYKENMAKALEYFEEELKIAQITGSKNDISFAINHLGHVYQFLENMPRAIECYESAKLLKIELGDKIGLCKVFFNLGSISFEQNKYDQAIEYYEQVVELAKKNHVNSFLPTSLYNIACSKFHKCLYEEAESVNTEALQLAKEVKDDDIVFSSTILSHKLLALENQTEAVANLTQMLSSETEESNLAIINYEIYKINQSAEHGQKALKIYQELYSKTPNIEYKNRVDELLVL